MPPSSTLSLFSLLFLSSLISTHAVDFEITNECTFTVWPAIIPGGGSQLDAGQTTNVEVNPGTTMGRVWGRTGCNFDATGHGQCQSGDCNGVLNCTTLGTLPITVAEFSLGQAGDEDVYGFSSVDGFNIPMEFFPTNDNCPKIFCTSIEECATNTSNCPSGANYRVIFCPSGSSSRVHLEMPGSSKAEY